MRQSTVRQRWNEGRIASCIACQLQDPTVFEIASTSGFDCLWLCLEHKPVSVESAVDLMRAARVGSADVMARPGKGEFMRMGRLLDAGAQGILYPRCDDAAEAQQVVRWSKFAPLGERGFYGSNPASDFGRAGARAFVEHANAQTWIAVQVESPDAVPHTRAMAEVEGIDMIFFGPADYSLLAGQPGGFQTKETLAAAEAVCRQTLAAGKRFGTLCFDAQHVRQMKDMGATFISMNSDMDLMRQSMEQQVKQYRDWFA